MTVTERDSKAALSAVLFDVKRVGRMLKTARLEARLALKSVSEASGIAASHIWNIEEGHKEVSIEKLVRLACFYGFPPGRLLEHGVEIRAEPFLATITDLEEVRSVSDPLTVEGRKTQDLVANYITASAIIVAYMLRSTSPYFLAESFAWPSPKLKVRFLRAATKIEYQMPPYRRMLIALDLVLRPFEVLLRFKLYERAEALSFARLAASGGLPFQIPWKPAPRDLLDFTHVLIVPEQTSEERQYFNLLGKTKEEISLETFWSGATESGISKNNLTGNSVATSVAPAVTKTISTWPELREELKKLTSERGAKASLARQFGVTPQAVSDWLREVYSPEADTVLKLLRWVENPQRSLTSETNSGAGATAPESKTRTKDTDESKPKSGRRKS